MKPDRYKWAVVGMLWGISFFNYADRQAVFSVFPLLEKELHLTSVQLGLLGSSFALVYGICGIFAGAIVDRVRRVSAILWGLYIWSLICVSTAVSRTFGQLLGFRAAEGLGETLYFPASMSLISDYHGRETRSRAMGLHQTSVYIGTVAGGFFAGLIGQHYGWRWSFIVFGGSGILLGAVLHRFLREPARTGIPACPTPPLRVVRRSPAQAHRSLPAGRLPVRQLRGGRAALVDAQVPLRQIPHDARHGGSHGHHLRATREHGRFARSAAGWRTRCARRGPAAA